MKTDTQYIEQAAKDHPYLQEIAKAEQKVSVTDTSSAYDDGGSMSDFDFYIDPMIVQVICIVVLAAIVALVVWKLVKEYNLHRQGGTETTGDTPMPDSIDGHDWDRELASARDNADYNTIAVLTYLRMLSNLDSAGIITFDKSKTPAMYIDQTDMAVKGAKAEMDAKADMTAKAEMADLPDRLRRLTDLYLLVRYGHRNLQQSDIADLPRNEVNAHVSPQQPTMP